MAEKYRCYTLYDITPTGVNNRRLPSNIPSHLLPEWHQKRDAQCNFDTIVQVLGLRTQVDILTMPTKLDESILGSPCWAFEFQPTHDGIYNMNDQPLTLLYQDCQNVPMLLTPETLHLSKFLSDATIYFELIPA